MIAISEIKDRAGIKKFVRFPWLIYRNDPNWVPPLLKDKEDFLNPEKNPYYKHSRVLLLMAYRDGKPVGRLSVHENTEHVKRHNEKIGFFGFFECIDDFDVAKAMFDYGKEWLRKLGYLKMRGPANFSINGEYSLLVDGFDSPPMVMMTYNPPYYATLLERYGFKNSQNMYAYQIDLSVGLPDAALKFATAVETSRKDYRVRKVDLKHYDRDVGIVHTIYTQAWDDNWGAVPETEAEIRALAKDLKMVIDKNIAFVGELNGQPIGFSLSIPDINQAIRTANGKLFPFGLLRILLKKRHIDSMRVLVMGVLKEHRHQGFDAVFYKRTLEEGRKKGYKTAEMSLINESNAPMRQVLERIGAKIYKTYRMYDLDII